MPNNTILIIDDESSICDAFQRFFTKRGWHVSTAANIANARARLKEQSFTVIFLDIRLPDGDGLVFLDELSTEQSGKIIVMSAYGTLERIMQTIKGKAYDYLSKPIDLDKTEQLLQVIQKEIEIVKDKKSQSSEKTAIIGQSKPMQELYKKISLVAMTDASILIHGETGTGKELVAQAIHKHSPRHSNNFTAINCAALPETLIESELFGYAKGAFTGAATETKGKFEHANNGTIFLDEIGEMPLPAQAKLLRVLDTKQIEKLGSSHTIKINVRILAATNKDLYQEVIAGRFRADLFYRLNVICINLPTLNQRGNDIHLLTHAFANQLNPNVKITKKTLSTLKAYHWPGNVRELKNAIEHAIVISGSDTILPEHLPDRISIKKDTNQPLESYQTLQNLICKLTLDEGKYYQQVIELAEKAIIEHVLEITHGKRSDAAELLGLHRNTLREKIKSYTK